MFENPRLPLFPPKAAKGWPNWLRFWSPKGGRLLPPPDAFALNQRQRHLLRDTALFLSHASKAHDPLIMAEELRQARLALDALTGRASTEDMLDALFGRFCIGK
jgi:tRNA modification GTPase